MIFTVLSRFLHHFLMDSGKRNESFHFSIITFKSSFKNNYEIHFINSQYDFRTYACYLLHLLESPISGVGCSFRQVATIKCTTLIKIVIHNAFKCFSIHFLYLIPRLLMLLTFAFFYFFC